MKKTILLLVILSLLAVPVAVSAATEFSLGGFIKLDSFWDSTQESRPLVSAINRNNDKQFQHGRFYMTAQGSRFNFTIKGPKIWGAQVTGLIEVDFDAVADPTNLSSTHSYSPRLRHAMFRLNWPQTELLMGQYWTFMSEFLPETTDDGAMWLRGATLDRKPQIRVTQKWCDFTFSGMVAKPEDIGDVNSPTAFGSGGAYTLNNPGPNSETPQLQGKIAYEKDLWGKAAYWGVPRGFVAEVVGGYQRQRFQYGQAVNRNFNGQNVGEYINADKVKIFPGVFTRDNQNLDSWVVMGDLFIPVVPCYSANLAGTASILAQWFVGQGLESFGLARKQDNSHFTSVGTFDQSGFIDDGVLADRTMTKMTGGFVQGQYWFNNQWYLNVAWGMVRAYGIGRNDGWASGNGEPMKCMWEVQPALWYRPIQALKFGVSYTYIRTNWFYRLDTYGNGSSSIFAEHPEKQLYNPQDKGEAHRVNFVGYFFF